MATSARPSKAARKGPPEPSAARRTSAWGNNARSSPTYSSAGAPPRQQQPQQQQAQTTAPAPAAPQGQPAFPPLAQNQNQSPAPATSSSPAPAAPRDRVLQALSGLTGTTVTILTKTGQRFEGVVGSTTATEGDTTGVTLKDAKDVSAPGAPLKDSLFVAATNIENYTSGPADARPTNGDTFRTDTDISAHKTHPRERDLQAWVPASTDPSAPLDEDTFSLGLGGANANGTTSWDQFTVNEQLFGVKGSFDENVYTTKLDRSAPDFKEREKRAMRIASEIMGSAANNPHVAEERGLVVDDSGANEEDKYGAVVRGQNAYVPPGARRQQAAAAGGGAGGVNAANANAGANANANATDSIPKVAVNGPDGSSVPASNGTSKAQSPPSSKAASPSPVGVPSASGATKPPADALPAFRDFVKDEKQRLTEKRQALQRGEREKRLADLKSWSQMFKLNKPIPDDLVPILAKDEEKQRLIREKAMQDAADAKAKAIAASTPTTSSRGIGVPGVVAGQAKGATGGKPVSSSSQAVVGGKAGVTGPSASTSQKTLAGTTSGSNTASNSASATPTQKPLSSGGASGSGSGSGGSGSGSGSGGKNLKISMFIPPIPPFKGGNKAKMGAGVAGGQGVPGTSAGSGGAGSAGAGGAGAGKNGANGVNTNVGKAPSPASPAGGANANAANNARLNVNASSFRPNPKASAFSPLTANSPKPGANGALPPSNSVSPKPKSDSTPATPNPFFGTRPIKKSAPVHVKDDFNPFKHNKVVDASQVAAIWPYSGKRYMQMFPQPAHPPAPHPAHMAPAGVVPGPPMPPPSYEEDSAAQQAAAAVAVGQQPPQHRGYVYAYPQYGYPPQMMPGMPPPGPPGAYMPGPYMQPMPYPPGMPPPNAMYSPAMGQMPPPQAYMQPPPPGAYPPPPNGAGPRPSMPPTPIPAHAHPYYHQSPQLQHAYPMMMPPPPPNMAPPHGYEGAPAPPPVPMQGGHA